MKPDPSIRTRCSFFWSAAGAISAGSRISVSAGVAGSFFQHVEARAIGAQHRILLDVQEHPRMAQRGVAAVASDRAVVHVDDFGRAGGGAVHIAVRILYGGEGSYDSDATHAFNLAGRGVRAAEAGPAP